MEFYVIGKIVNTHGIKGELKILNQTSFDRFEKGNYVYIDENKFIIKTHRINQGFDFVTFEGYEDINLVLPLKNKIIMIDETQREELVEDEFYYTDLIGKRVLNEDLVFLGVVSGIRELPQGELLEVKTHKKNLALIPFRKEFIVKVEEDIIIHEIEGLI